MDSTSYYLLFIVLSASASLFLSLQSLHSSDVFDIGLCNLKPHCHHGQKRAIKQSLFHRVFWKINSLIYKKTIFILLCLLQIFFLYRFFKGLFIWNSELLREREWQEISSVCQFIPQMDVLSRVGLGQSQEPGTSYGCPT